MIRLIIYFTPILTNDISVNVRPSAVILLAIRVSTAITSAILIVIARRKDGYHRTRNNSINKCQNT